MDLDSSITFWKSNPSDEQLASVVEEWKKAFLHPEKEESDLHHQHIVTMTFFAPAEVQWRFILISVQRVIDPDQIENLAAGPLEGFLGKFGEKWIDQIEDECKTNWKLRRALWGVWQHQMSDETYKRIQLLAATLES